MKRQPVIKHRNVHTITVRKGMPTIVEVSGFRSFIDGVEHHVVNGETRKGRNIENEHATYDRIHKASMFSQGGIFAGFSSSGGTFWFHGM